VKGVNMKMIKCPVFICYRQVDGTKIAQWLFENLNGQRLPDIGHVETEEKVSSLDVYFDQRAPAVSDWKAIHQPRLRTSQAMIIVCTPGAFQKLEKDDWVHREIDWWLRNRKVAPILIDATGEGERWVPKGIKDRWKDAQRITVVQDDLLRLQGKDLQLFEEQVRSRILNGIVLSKQRYVSEELDRKKKMSRRLKIALLVAGILLLSTVAAAILMMRARDRAEKNAQIATNNARIATVRRLAAESKAADRPRVAIALALEAYRRTAEHGLRVPDGEQALRDVVGDAGVCVLQGHTDMVTSIVFSPNNRWLVTVCDDGIVRLWSLKFYYSLRDKGWLVEKAGKGSFLRLLPTAGLGDLVSGDPILIRGHKGKVCAAVFTLDSNRLITSGDDGTARIWDLTAEVPSKSVTVLDGHDGAINVMGISPDGHWLVTGSEDGTCRFWDLTIEESTDASQVLRGHTTGVCFMGISSNGRWLATISRDGTAQLWDLSNETSSLAPIVLCVGGNRFTGEKDIWVDLVFSPDSRLLVTVSADGSPYSWDLTAANPLEGVTALPGGKDDQSYRSVHAISCDCRWLASSGGLVARLWALADEDQSPEALVLAGHTRSIWDMTFTPDGRRLVTCDLFGRVLLWDLTAPKPQGTRVLLRGHGNDLRVLVVSPDGHWLVGGGGSGVTLWSLRADDMVPLALRCLRVSLTELEWLRYFPNEEYRDIGADW
jgi:WD40 repeat protein